MDAQEIIDLILNRRENGADELLKNYGPLIKYIITPILSDERDREECLLDVLMLVWNKIELYDSRRGSWTAWLTAVSRNAALNRRYRSAGHADMLVLSEHVVTDVPTPEQSVLQKEKNRNMLRALSRLPKKERELFYRKYYYLQTTAQIARESGCTERAVEGRLYRLKKRLRRELKEDIYE